MRFAFYGRVSTEDQQDPESSRAWQLSRAEALIRPYDGEVVTEFFDIAKSRSLPWRRRPQASALLDTFTDTQRGFDAVVIGEPARAFYGNQFGLTFPIFIHYDVELWVPEVGGRVQPDSDAHELVMAMFGGLSKGERMRIRTRVRSAMKVQTANEGRFLGGRPPYGYVIADAGPHPHGGKAAMGQRLHRLDLDPIAAPVVRRIFDEWLSGTGLNTITGELTRDGILCPSAHDRARNSHRNGDAWTKAAVRSILTNPRYTGFQVWNRQRREETLIDVHDVALGHESRMRWNSADEWVWSSAQSHDALITVDEFEAAQERVRISTRSRTDRKVRPATNSYVLRGLVHCGRCNRRMEGGVNHGHTYYRCRMPKDYARVNGIDHPATVNLRESAVLPLLDSWLAGLFDEEAIEETCRALATAGESTEANREQRAARRAIRECDDKLTKYRTLLEAGTDAALVAAWIREVTDDRAQAERALRNQKSEAAPTLAEIKAQLEVLEAAYGDLEHMLARAKPEEKAAVYADLGITLTYHPERKVVAVTSNPCGFRSVGESLWFGQVVDCMSGQFVDTCFGGLHGSRSLRR